MCPVGQKLDGASVLNSVYLMCIKTAENKLFPFKKAINMWVLKTETAHSGVSCTYSLRKGSMLIVNWAEAHTSHTLEMQIIHYVKSNSETELWGIVCLLLLVTDTFSLAVRAQLHVLN